MRGRPTGEIPKQSASSLNQPTIAVASGSELFVVDSANHRLLVFPLSNLGQNSSATAAARPIRIFLSERRI